MIKLSQIAVMTLTRTTASSRPVERNATAASQTCRLTRAFRHRREGARFGFRPTLLFALVILLLPTFAATQTLSGTVKNATTGKPSPENEVVLLNLGQGMEEVGRTKTDTNGNFSFSVDNTHNPHLVRAIHEGVAYHRVVPAGTASVALEVYDVAKNVDGIVVFADIMRIEAARGQIVVTREFGVQNASTPPFTQMNERNLEFYVPDNAQVIDAVATTQNGFPLKSSPVPAGDKNRYSFNFPLRPGLTRFAVTYQLPYSGSANLDPKSLYPLEHFMIMLPTSMQFKAMSSSTGFKLIHLPNQPDVMVHVAEDTTDGENLAFRISGEGVLTTGQQKYLQNSDVRKESSIGGASGAQSNDRPGGGLGPPIDAPDPLKKYRWWILGGSAALLLIGGTYVVSRLQSATQRWHQKGGPSLLMAGIEEELFQIELERKKGQISQAEFERVKTALDQTLRRASKRDAHGIHLSRE
jgi:hypothetical protein